MFNEIEKIIAFRGESATLTIPKESAAKAIDKDWESLYFANNANVFAMLETENQKFQLVTNGHVRILGVNTQEIYTNSDPDEIERLLDTVMVDGSFPDDTYFIDDNNWFSVIVTEAVILSNGDVIWRVTDDILFEDIPKTVEELEILFLEHVAELQAEGGTIPS